MNSGLERQQVEPAFTLILMCNTLPEPVNFSGGILRRLKVIPF